MTDTFRSGDSDFEQVRSRFYGMVERHLRNVPDQPTSKRPDKGNRKRKKAKVEVSKKPEPGRDGQPFLESTWTTEEGPRGFRNDFGDALEWLILKGKLIHGADGDTGDQVRERRHSLANDRFKTADDLLQLLDAAELTPIRSPDYSSTPVSGGGPRFVGLSKMVAQMKVQDIRHDVPVAAMRLLEAILIGNRHVWHDRPKKTQEAIFKEICLAIDLVGWSMDRDRSMDQNRAAHVDIYEKATADLIRRWPEVFDWIVEKRLRSVTHSARRLSPNDTRGTKQKAPEPSVAPAEGGK